jgi:nitrate/nitrite transport system ATP-binding protein
MADGKENVAIGVDKVHPRASQAERQDVVEYHLERVGLADSMKGRKPVQWYVQRAESFSALRYQLKLLLLDEPQLLTV